jgi:hypothetical protein
MVHTHEDPRSATGVDAARAASTPYRTASFKALDFDFCIESTELALRDHLDGIYAPLRSTQRATHVYRLIDLGPLPGQDRYFALLGEDLIVAGPTPSFPVWSMMWHINNQAVTTNSRLLLVHAAAAESHGRAVILPAPAESGKTTLVAGLVRNGLRYLTDEAVALRLDGDERVVPYPKPLTIEAGSQEVLADLRPEVDELISGYLTGPWHVSPLSIRISAVADCAVPRFLVVPRYAADGPTALSPLRRVEALRRVAEGTFNLETFGRRGFERLAQLVRGCQCYELAVADLERACQMVLTLFDSPEASS